MKCDSRCHLHGERGGRVLDSSLSSFRYARSQQLGSNKSVRKRRGGKKYAECTRDRVNLLHYIWRRGERSMIHEINWTQRVERRNYFCFFLVTMLCDLFLQRVSVCMCVCVCDIWFWDWKSVHSADDRAYAGNSQRKRWMQGEREKSKWLLF